MCPNDDGGDDNNNNDENNNENVWVELHSRLLNYKLDSLFLCQVYQLKFATIYHQ